jgi:RNA polymerase sigma-70 factor (ECF subfamily)
MSDGKQPKGDLSLEALRRGDRAEFARMVEAYSGLIYRLALKMLHDPQDAEDILQETFVKAYRHLPDFDGRSSLSTWLYRIATNEALMSLRRVRFDQVSIDDPSDGEDEDVEPLQILDWCCMPEEEMLSEEARAFMQESIEALPASLRVVFLLRDIDGLSTRDVSQVLDLSEEAVKTRLSRARLRLRGMLTGYYGEQLLKKQADKGGES